MNIINEKYYFIRSTNFMLLSQKEIQQLITSFLKFIIAVMGGHCDYSPWALKNLAMPWCILEVMYDEV